MCGRFLITSTQEAMIAFARAMGSYAVKPCYNIGPTLPVPVIRETGQGREIAPMRWGFIPGWMKQVPDKPFINARAETIEEKPSFKSAIKRRRGIIPADGFYEWAHKLKKVPAGGRDPKQPYLITTSSGEMMAMAAIWERWQHADGSDVETVAIVTVAANKTLAPIHHRMPVLLHPDDFDQWLTGPEDAQLTAPLDPRVRRLMQPAPDDFLTIRPVSKRVNAIRNNDPALLDEVEEDSDEDKADQLSHF